MKRTKLQAEWFWVDRWDASSAALLPMEAQGVYRAMLSQAWLRGGSLPNDEDAIKRAVRCTSDEWARCWPKIKTYWRQEDDKLVNDTQLEVYAETVAIRDRSYERAMKAAAASPQVKTKRLRDRAQAEPQGKDGQKLEVNLEESPPFSVLQSLPTPVERLGSVPATGNGNGHRTEPGLSPPKHPPGALERYVRAVHEALSEKRGSLTPLSSVEFDMAAKWHDAGVPLRVVLRGLADCSRKPPNLLYARPAIEEAIAYHRKALA